MSAYQTFKFLGRSLKDTISIIGGNRKVLGVPNTSFPPITTCNPDAPCTKKGCYIFPLYPTQQQCYDKNLRIYNDNPSQYFSFISEFVSAVNPSMFRYNVSGDMPDYNYLQGIIATAIEFPNTSFVAYTKKYDILKQAIKDKFPSNLITFASAWPNFELPKIIRENFRIAWMQDNTETRNPKNSFVCEGYCETCRFCYSTKTKRDVVFNKH